MCEIDFFTFIDLPFSAFFVFYEMTHFDQMHVLGSFWLKALLHREENDDKCGGSPLIVYVLSFCLLSFCCLHVGEIHRRGDVKSIHSFSPL